MSFVDDDDGYSGSSESDVETEELHNFLLRNRQVIEDPNDEGQSHSEENS